MAPHHLEKGEKSKWREGVVVEHKGAKLSSLVNVGLERKVKIDRKLPPGTRATVRMNAGGGKGKRETGIAVSPSEPRTKEGLYWGYTVRMAENLAEIWSGCTYKGNRVCCLVCEFSLRSLTLGGYDYVIGTSENGDCSMDSPTYTLPKFKVSVSLSSTFVMSSSNSCGIPLSKHLLIVFGGVEGLERAVEDCEELSVSASRTRYLFDEYVNSCAAQGSRTIRTEEAVLITLSLLRPLIQNHMNNPNQLDRE